MSIPDDGDGRALVKRGPQWAVCPNCHGHGQGQGDESGWDGTSMHTPSCPVCGGRGEVPTCTNVHDSCHGDPEVDECACARRVREQMDEMARPAYHPGHEEGAT